MTHEQKIESIARHMWGLAAASDPSIVGWDESDNATLKQHYLHAAEMAAVAFTDSCKRLWFMRKFTDA